MKQLRLTKKHLKKIGFAEKVYPSRGIQSKLTTFEIKTINGCFYYNTADEKYRWYQRVILGETSNHIHLDIKKLPELFTVLDCFQVKYNLIIMDKQPVCPICESPLEDSGCCSDVGSNNCTYQK